MERKAEAAIAAEKRATELERQLAEIASAKEKAQQEADAANVEAELVKAEVIAVKARADEAERKAKAAIAVAAQLVAADAQAQAEADAAKEAEPKQGDSINDDATGMKLAYVPSGCFMMGSSTDDEGHENDEGPVHKVCVDSFWMGQYEVTQGQWEKVMGANPSKFKKGGNYPVERVSWNDVQDFIKKLNSSTGKSYRLPTEAEWEYACRANSPGKYCGGDDIDALAWHSKNSGDSTHPVGGKQGNGFGLYDMSGNVYEWCADWYGKDYYASSSQSNPVVPNSGSNRVIRGGAWLSPLRFGRAAFRNWSRPDNSEGYLGFRLVLSVKAL
ncbi:SUMF1/EgtB/PvdO family nonheme iron enzyme [Desulfobulbus sp. F5]|nr:SUMF1/EgtB/PvdO family nonheme iron enzyme [Desulfobulbus sp. F5]